MGWQNRNTSAVAADEPGLEYPFIQWVNRGQDLDPRRKDGGWFMTEENVNLLDALPVGATAAAMNFSTGESETGVFAEAISIAPLLTRFSWVVREGNRLVHSPTYSPGARGKLNLLAYIQTEAGIKGPIFITLTGTVTKDLSEALSAHRQRVRQATKGAAPAPLFLMTLHPRPQVMRGKAGQQSKVTPIVLAEDFDVDAAYVGDALADEIEGRWSEFKEWKERWTASADAPMPEEPPAEDEAPGAPPAPRVSAKPAKSDPGPLEEARNRWSDAWNALKKAGIATAFLNPGYNADQINAAAQVMEGALAQVAAQVPRDEIKDYLAVALAAI